FVGLCCFLFVVFFFSSRRRHTRSKRDWSSDVCSSDLLIGTLESADALSTVQMIATQNSELAAQIMAKLRSSTTVNGTFNFTGEFEALAKTIYLDAYASKTPLGEITQPQSLAQLFLRADNPFAHEIMAIRLMKGL